MPLTFITDVRPGEPEILPRVANETLRITDLDGVEIIQIHPVSGPWTHDKLVQVGESLVILDVLKNGANAYLGDTWIGSTEV